ncbi:hypothetical protein CR513_06608, partial [Mucuna pruriens]
MEGASDSGTNQKGYAWAVSAGFNAALAAISVKLPLHQIRYLLGTEQFVRYGMVLLFNVTMWACYVNSLKALSSLQATVTNFATNFISSGLAGFFFFKESLSFQVPLLLSIITVPQWFAGALLIIIGVVILSNSSIENKFTEASICSCKEAYFGQELGNIRNSKVQSATSMNVVQNSSATTRSNDNVAEGKYHWGGGGGGKHSFGGL